MRQGVHFIFIIQIIFNLCYAENLGNFGPMENNSEINKRDLLGIFENMFEQRVES